ncbi:hypothetical protein EDB86DRAFT_961020 [Lactarius hatsudake]|nr:hypothetical protein EDB86DRAFT_961020 [Lactarius hatsudake]
MCSYRSSAEPKEDPGVPRFPTFKFRKEMRSMLHTCRPILLSPRRKKVRRFNALVLAWLVAFAPMHGFSPAMPEMPSVGSREMMVQEVHRARWRESGWVCAQHDRTWCRQECPGTPEAHPPHDLNASLPLRGVARISQHGDDTGSSVNKNNRGGQYNTVINATIVIAAHIVGLHGSEWPQRGRYPLRRRRGCARQRAAQVRSALRRSPRCRHHAASGGRMAGWWVDSPIAIMVTECARGRSRWRTKSYSVTT